MDAKISGSEDSSASVKKALAAFPDADTGNSFRERRRSEEDAARRLHKFPHSKHSSKENAPLDAAFGIMSEPIIRKIGNCYVWRKILFFKRANSTLFKRCEESGQLSVLSPKFHKLNMKQITHVTEFSVSH
jgi:hypothetical protein